MPNCRLRDKQGKISLLEAEKEYLSQSNVTHKSGNSQLEETLCIE